jgi:phosphatidylglycerophosphate synthase
MSTIQKKGARREVATRRASWAMAIAKNLARIGLRPNTISGASVLFAALAGGCLFFSADQRGWTGSALFVAAIFFMQLRLLCNLFDGMVAVECGLKTKSGEVFNDFPDRIADPLILLGAGYAARAVPHAVELAWLAALLAVATAYVRLLGSSAGAKQYFLGPMAKQHRMAVMTVAALASAIVPHHARVILLGTLALIAAGCVITIIRRLTAIVRELEAS